MLLKKIVEDVTEWVDENICEGLQLKLPDDYKNDNNYDVVFVRPAAFPLFPPGTDRLPPGVAAPIPSISVQLMEGTDHTLQNSRQLSIRLCIACWNPGIHSDAKFYPTVDEDAEYGYHYNLGNDGVEQSYERNIDGWKDAFNLLDRTISKLENTEFIAGCRIDHAEGIKYGMFTEEGKIWDYYPYWHSYVSFKLDCGTGAILPDAYKDLL